MFLRHSVFVFGALISICLAVPAVAAGWSHYGGDAGGQRHSAAAQITPANVGTLKPVWTYRTGDMKTRADDMKYSAFEGTPILVAGSLIFCSPFNEVIALDPGTGAEKWRYDPEVKGGYRPANQFVCRGVTQWTDAEAAPGDLCASRLFMGTVDSRLIALDAPTGQPCLGFGAEGQVQVDPGMELVGPGEFHITSPPAVARGVVIIGSAISDNRRADAPSGTVRAYDARTGAALWDFNPVARGAEDFPDDWQYGSAERTGHANVWAPMSADEARGLFFLPTSSPSPDFFGGERIGDNRYANSVVALEAETGNVRWHFQTVHHDVWDYDLPAQPSLVTLQRDGKPLDAVVQVTKQGFVFVFDRDTGEPVFEIEERQVPQGGVLGEVLSPTQPFPIAPPPLVPQHLTPDDAWGLTFWDRKACREEIAGARSEGLYTPPSEQGTILFPFTGGGANWGGMAFDPASQIMYVNTSRAAHIVTLIPRADFAAAKAAEPKKEISPQEGTAWGMKRDLLLSPLDLPCNPPPWGMLHAIDLNDGTIVWESVLGTVRDLAPFPLPWKLGTPNFGGPVVTAGGVVFIGAAMDDYLRAFDAATGAELWKGRLPAGGQATPMTYEWEGRQYVVIAAGGHARATTKLGDYVMAFALPE
ncbi:MAG: pyrroloquinoline quinone-dependent dehydrogenase [Parvibaculum sp.]|nr:pyrroloquinoline quinone-dependent dehydrogenase [Parvibaculum sp.]MCW5727638.1 pyrroloquinoline quinone-dependent dehydrogenase [Parvibaculum sp.]